MARPVPTRVLAAGEDDRILGYGLGVDRHPDLHYYLVGYLPDAYRGLPNTAALHASNGLFLRLVHGESK